MMYFKWVISSLLFAMLVSCTHKQTTLQAHANKFAMLESKAIILREKRFALADQIRFANDSIIQFAKTVDTSKLHKKIVLYNSNKEIMLQQSLALAETIRHELNNLMKNELQDKDDRAQFEKLLNQALVKKGHVTTL